MTGCNPTLFGSSAKRDNHNGAVVVLSSSHTIFPLFSRGCLVPALFEENADEAPASQVARWLPRCTGPLPANWVAELLRSARNVIPIAIQLKDGRDLAERVIGEVCVPVVRAADVQAVIFRSEEELRRFTSWTYEDCDPGASGIELGCKPELFEGPESKI